MVYLEFSWTRNQHALLRGLGSRYLKPGGFHCSSAASTAAPTAVDTHVSSQAVLQPHLVNGVRDWIWLVGHGFPAPDLDRSSHLAHRGEGSSELAGTDPSRWSLLAEAGWWEGSLALDSGLVVG